MGERTLTIADQWLANPNIIENEKVSDFRRVIEAFVEVNQTSEVRLRFPGPSGHGSDRCNPLSL